MCSYIDLRVLFFCSQEAFHAFHPEIDRVQKYLKPFYIGDVSNEEIESIDDDQAIKDDFAKLRQKAVEKKLFQSSPFFFILTCLHIILFEFAAYFILFRFGIGWTPYFIALACHVIAEVSD